MTDGDATPADSSADTKSSAIREARNHSNLYGIPYLCNRTACRRAHSCRGTGACLKTYMSAVPEGARAWVVFLFYLTRELGYPFEEAIAKAYELKEVEIYARWMESIGAWKEGRDFRRLP